MKYIEGNMYGDIMCDFKIKITQNMHWIKCIKFYVLNEKQNIKHIQITYLYKWDGFNEINTIKCISFNAFGSFTKIG